MAFQLSTVSSVHYSTGQKKYDPPNNNWKKNKNTFNKPFHYVNTQDGPWTELKRRPGVHIQSRNKGKRLTDKNTKSITRRTYITVPYSKGLSESFKNTCKKYGIQVYFRGGKTIKDLLVAPKDRDHITKKSGIIYRYKCDRVQYDEEYIGELARTFWERFKEHFKCPSPTYDHSNMSGHSTTLDNFSI